MSCAEKPKKERFSESPPHLCALLLLRSQPYRSCPLHAPKAELAGPDPARWERGVQSGNPRLRGPGRTRIPLPVCESRAWATTKSFWKAHRLELWPSAPLVSLNGTALGEKGNLVLAGHRTSFQAAGKYRPGRHH